MAPLKEAVLYQLTQHQQIVEAYGWSTYGTLITVASP